MSQHDSRIKKPERNAAKSAVVASDPANAACAASFNGRALRASVETDAAPLLQSRLVTVGHNPNSVTLVGRIDGTSWYFTRRPDFVAERFQINAHSVEYQIGL